MFLLILRTNGNISAPQLLQENQWASLFDRTLLLGFHRWESVRTLRTSFGYPSIYKIFAKARNNFICTSLNQLSYLLLIEVVLVPCVAV